MGMRRTGVQVDVTQFKIHRENFNTLLDEYRTTFTGYGIPVAFQLGATGTHPSLAKLFFNEFGVTPISYSEKTNEPSLDKRALEEYATLPGLVGNTARTIRQFRKIAKLLSSYIDNLPRDKFDVSHPTWRCFGTRTGRWSATDPALQTIPKEKLKSGVPSLRNLFCARPGRFFVDADWSALEARVFAVLAQAKLLLQWFEEFDAGRGIDVHTRNAQAIFRCEKPTKQQRDLAKSVLYCLLYGGGPEVAWRALVPDYPNLKLSGVVGVFTLFFNLHHEIQEYQEKHLWLCKKQNYVEAPLSGRRQVYHNGRIVPTECLNFPNQATAGDLANRAIIAIAGELNDDECLVWQCHDALGLEGPNPERLAGILRRHMQAPILLNGQTVIFPAEPEYGHDWANLRKFS